jgi:hypothetical protein
MDGGQTRHTRLSIIPSTPGPGETKFLATPLDRDSPATSMIVSPRVCATYCAQGVENLWVKRRYRFEWRLHGNVRRYGDTGSMKMFDTERLDKGSLMHWDDKGSRVLLLHITLRGFNQP